MAANNVKREDALEEIISDFYTEKIEETAKAEDLNIDALLDGAYAEIEEKVNTKRLNERRTRKIKHFKVAVLVLVIITAGLSVFRPEAGYADLLRCMVSVMSGNEVRADNVLEEERSSYIDETEIPVEEVNEYMKMNDLIEEIENYSTLTLSLPEYLPNGYKVNTAYVTKYDDTIATIRILYIQKEKHVKILYQITEEKYKKALSAAFDVESVNMEIIENEYRKYLYFSDSDSGDASLYWEENECAFRISGGEGKEELLKMANSIKK